MKDNKAKPVKKAVLGKKNVFGDGKAGSGAVARAYRNRLDEAIDGPKKKPK